MSPKSLSTYSVFCHEAVVFPINYDHLLANPVAGASWESFAMENIIAAHSHWRSSFIRTSNGAEIDLILERGGRQLLFEFKLSKAPRPARGFYELQNALRPEAALVISTC